MTLLLIGYGHRTGGYIILAFLILLVSFNKSLLLNDFLRKNNNYNDKGGTPVHVVSGFSALA